MEQRSSILLSGLVAALLATTYWVLMYVDLTQLRDQPSPYPPALNVETPSRNLNPANALSFSQFAQSRQRSIEEYLIIGETLNLETMIEIAGQLDFASQFMDQLAFDTNTRGHENAAMYGENIKLALTYFQLSTQLERIECGDQICAASYSNYHSDESNQAFFQSLEDRSQTHPIYANLKIFTRPVGQTDQTFIQIFSISEHLDQILIAGPTRATVARVKLEY